MLVGSFDGELLEMSQYKSELDTIKEVTKSKVISAPEVVSIRIAGLQMLNKIFNDFTCAVLSKDKTYKDKLLIDILPKVYRPHDDESNYQKLLKITDFISGMTDSYATHLFQKLNGITLD